jgi:hypothetical protein
MVLTFIAGVARTPILFFQSAQEYNAKSSVLPSFPNEILQPFLRVAKIFVEPARICQGKY